MCGICGIIGKTQDREKQVVKMTEALSHRGPDDAGTASFCNLSFGMRRLAILDLSAKGHQPMSNPEANIHIVYNGELYNFRTEKQILIKKGYQFHSETDTEVILYMYQEYGDDFLLRMRGIFALAIFDQRSGEKVILARDQLGVKPLVYAQSEGVVVFASEIKAILKSDLIEKKVDSEALRLLLTYGSVLQPSTIIENVKMLLPAHRLIWNNGKAKIEKYWQLGENRLDKVRALPYHEQVELTRHTLEESVKMQMVSDAPLGAFLSGGVDSSLLVALMAKNSQKKIKTFSIGFETDAEIDETEDAQKIAKYLGTDHHRVLITGQDVKNQIKNIARSLDQPSVDGANAFFVSMAAKKMVTVAISGTGGDELFAGYPWFANMVKFAGQKHHYDKLSHFFGQEFFDFIAKSDAIYRPGLEKIREQNFLSYFSRQYGIFNPYLTAKILARDRRSEAHLGWEQAVDMALADELPEAETVNRVSALCLRGYTLNQLLRDIDATSMFQSLEVRVPFLDPVLTDLALSLPPSAKLNNRVVGQSETQTYRKLGAKKILIDIGKELLPENMDAQVKKGFAMPFDYWLKEDLREILADCLSEETVKKRGFFNFEEVDKLYRKFLLGEVHWTRVWLLMMTELWAREVLDS